MTDRAPVHLTVIQGPEKDRPILIPPKGGRIGRSKENDIHLSDDSLSRFHCRMFFKEDLLRVADLGSTNETLVNGKAIMEQELVPGDLVEIGETVFKVLSNKLDGQQPLETPGPNIDLGFGSPSQDNPSGKKRPLPIPGIVLAVVILLVFAGFMAFRPPAPDRNPTASTQTELFIKYEKIEADSENIFRYDLTLRNGQLSVRIDDLLNNRQVIEEKAISETLQKSLANSILEAGFFNLEQTYEGLARDTWDTLDLQVGINSRFYRSTVKNRIEPEVFQEVRMIIEDFSENELGLAALALPPEKLIELAREATLLAQKLYDQKSISAGNLYRSLQHFKEAIWYVETIEPKPDFYEAAVLGQRDAESELERLLDGQEFQAERAIKLNDWRSAANELRAIIEQLPDPEDSRYQKAQRKLLDVERRIK